MANRDVRKEVKKKKKKVDSGVVPSLKPMIPEPEKVTKTKRKGK